MLPLEALKAVQYIDSRYLLFLNWDFIKKLITDFN